MARHPAADGHLFAFLQVWEEICVITIFNALHEQNGFLVLILSVYCDGKSDKVVAVSILLHGVGNEVADKKALVHNCRLIKEAPHPKEIVAKLKSYGIGRGAVFCFYICSAKLKFKWISIRY